MLSSSTTIVISVLLGAAFLILFNWWSNTSAECDNGTKGNSSRTSGVDGNVDNGTLSSSTEAKTFTVMQVAEHAREDDAWIIVDGKVSYIKWTHPCHLALLMIISRFRPVCVRSS